MSSLPDQFVNVIREDRFCKACGENLRGSYIVREPHYQMLTTRCPTCGQVQSVQETRKLSRTGQRWTGLAVAFWFIALLTLWFGGTASMIGITVGVVEEARFDGFANGDTDCLPDVTGSGWQVIPETVSLPHNVRITRIYAGKHTSSPVILLRLRSDGVVEQNRVGGDVWCGWLTPSE